MKSSVAMIRARAEADADFKRCCLKSGKHDGANRGEYF